MKLAPWHIDHGDCRALLAALAADSVDSCVTDPPYELGFMGKAWDASGVAFDPETWRAVLRVLKPGAHLLAFGGTRTYHRMACAIEDVGFEVRDSIHWMYGSGFPKSHNLDGAHDGWGTALKPSHEPIVVARKPFKATVAANVAKHGTGAINIGGCRVEGAPRPLIDATANVIEGDGRFGSMGGSRAAGETTEGRWPPNVLLTHSADCRRLGDKQVKASNAPGMDRGSALGRMNDDAWQAQERKPQSYGVDGAETVAAYNCAPDCPVVLLDRQSVEMGMHSAGAARNAVVESDYEASSFDMSGARQMNRLGDSGGASRFFPAFEWAEEDFAPFLYCAKPDTSERQAGLPPRVKNDHPTVKPIALMRWLCRLVTPKGGIVLDPFAGSGTTLIAALRDNFRAHGCELRAKHIEIAGARIRGDAPLFLGGAA
jgi:hypothetical protein